MSVLGGGGGGRGLRLEAEHEREELFIGYLDPSVSIGVKRFKGAGQSLR